MLHYNTTFHTVAISDQRLADTPIVSALTTFSSATDRYFQRPALKILLDVTHYHQNQKRQSFDLYNIPSFISNFVYKYKHLYTNVYLQS